MEPLLDEPVQLTLELVGVFVFGISGGLLALRQSFDVVGLGVLAFLTALGGGLIRVDGTPDLRRQRGRPRSAASASRPDGSLDLTRGRRPSR